MTIKVKSAFKCGLVAGIVIIIIGFGLVPILGNEMNEVLETRSLPPLSNGAMGFFAVLSMLFGISLIWLYVLIQPKFNSKLKAALVAATVFWFYAYFLPNAALVAYGFMPFSLSAIGTAWGMLELSIASIIATRLYNRSQTKSQRNASDKMHKMSPHKIQ